MIFAGGVFATGRRKRQSVLELFDEECKIGWLRLSTKRKGDVRKE